MIEIPLTHGKVALVDSDAVHLVFGHKWWAVKKGPRFYAVTDVKRKRVYMHRLLLCTNLDVDHINGDGLDNRRANLRAATRQENVSNMRKRPGSSKFKGVCWDKRRDKWMAKIMVDYKTRFLGYFKDEIEAARAYDAAAVSNFGVFARLNFRVSP